MGRIIYTAVSPLDDPLLCFLEKQQNTTIPRNYLKKHPMDVSVALVLFGPSLRKINWDSFAKLGLEDFSSMT